MGIYIACRFSAKLLASLRNRLPNEHAMKSRWQRCEGSESEFKNKEAQESEEEADPQ